MGKYLTVALNPPHTQQCRAALHTLISYFHVFLGEVHSIRPLAIFFCWDTDINQSGELFPSIFSHPVGPDFPLQIAFLLVQRLFSSI